MIFPRCCNCNTLVLKVVWLFKYFQEAPAISVGSDLEALFAERGQIRDGTETVLPYVVVRGRVKELSQSIESSSGLKGVLQVVTLNEHSFRRHAFNHWCRVIDEILRFDGNFLVLIAYDLTDALNFCTKRGDSVRQIHQAHNSVPFALTNIHADKKVYDVEVDNPFDANSDSLLLTVSTNFTPTNSSVASTVMGFFTGVAVRGVEKTEEFLPVDTVVTGIGQLIKDGKGRIKIVEPPSDVPRPYILSTLPVESKCCFLTEWFSAL